jgi:hypothetical protein
MPSTTDDMIVALNGFQPHPQSADDQSRLYDITKGFDTLSDKTAVIPAMFALMERCPSADLGSPGPLVHSIESLAVDAYERELTESVRRRPMYLNVWMINRILNGKCSPARRQALVELLRGTLGHPAAADVSSSVLRFLQRHGGPGAG